MKGVVLCTLLLICIPSIGIARPLQHRILTAVKHSSAKYHIDERIIRAIIWVESSGRPHVVSRAGAIGLMQVIPKGKDRWVRGRNLFNVNVNIDVGVRTLKYFLYRAKGDLNRALAMYNGSSRKPRAKARYLRKFWVAYVSLDKP